LRTYGLLNEWATAAVFEQLHLEILDRLGVAGRLGLVACQRGQHERAGQAWGDHVGASPVDRGKPGSKLHLVCEGHGLPLTAAVTAANVPDVVMLTTPPSARRL
jgi:hypothetical protein